MEGFNVKRVAKAGLVCVIVAAVVGGGKLLFDGLSDNWPFRTQSAQLDARRAAAKKAGLPLTLADYAADGRQAGLDNYDRFMEFDKFVTSNPDVLAIISDDTKLPEFIARLEAEPGALQSLMDASMLQAVDLPMEFDKGVFSDPPRFATFGRYVETLCKLAKHEFSNKDHSKAEEYLQAAARLTSHLSDESAPQAVVGWASCANRVIKSSFRLMEAYPKDPAVLAMVRNILDQVQPPSSLEQCVKLDCLLFTTTARKYDSLSKAQKKAIQVQELQDRIDPPEGKHVSRALESRALAFWIEAVKIAAAPDGNLQAAGKRLDSLGAAWLKERDPSSYLARALPLTYEQVGMSVMRVVQMKLLVQAGASIVEQWQSTGSLPNAAALSKASFNDPLTGKPFLYSPAAGSFVLQATGSREPEKVRPPNGDLTLVPGQGYGLRLELP